MVLGPVFFCLIMENCWHHKFSFLQNMSFFFLFDKKLLGYILQVSVLAQPLAHPMLFKDKSCSRRQHSLLLRN